MAAAAGGRGACLSTPLSPAPPIRLRPPPVIIDIPPSSPPRRNSALLAYHRRQIEKHREKSPLPLNFSAKCANVFQPKKTNNMRRRRDKFRIGGAKSWCAVRRLPVESRSPPAAIHFVPDIVRKINGVLPATRLPPRD